MQGPLPPLPWLRSFEAAARHLSFTAAASEINVTQSAVSQQVRHLEAYLGRELFTRGPKGLSLTEAGHGYLPSVQGAFKLIASGTGAFRAPRQRRRLDIRANTAFSLVWLLPRIGGFLAANPEIELDLATVLWASDFRGPPASVEIRYGRGAPEGLRSNEEIVQDRLLPVSAPALAEGLGSPEDLAAGPLLHLAGAADSWRYWAKTQGLEGLERAPGHQLNSINAILVMTRAGQGVALGYEFLYREDLASGRLVAPFDLSVPAQDNLFLAVSETPSDPAAAQLFRGWLLAELESDPARH